MPITATPTSPIKVPPILNENEKATPKENMAFAGLDLARMSLVAESASLDIQADLRKRGIPYIIGRDGILLEVLPTGEEVPYTPNQ